MKSIMKFLRDFFSREVAPGVYYRGGYLYENTNKPTPPPPYKFKKSTNTK